MPNANQIGLEAIFDNKDFQNGISEYNKSTSEASTNTEDAAGSMELAWDGLAVVGEAVFAALVVAIGAMTAELYVAVDAAMETEDVLARMEFVVANVGKRTGVTTQDVLDLADSISKVVPIDDEVIVSAITMGLTFDGVNKDNIQPLIQAAADLAIWTGKDLPMTMKELALAISDPDKAMRLFRDANITLTDSETKTLKSMDKVGDSAKITAFILEKLRTKGIIGLGNAMGETAKGKMTIMQTALGNLQEALGAGLLESLKNVFDRITIFANDPRTLQFFTDLGTKIGEFASKVLDNLPGIMVTLDKLGNWFKDNQPIIVGILAALGVALLAFGYTAAAAGLTALIGLWPVIAIMAVVGLAAGLLYAAWTNDWGGIQEKTAALWAWLQPIFAAIQSWLSVNIPIAIAALSTFWTTVLLPAIQAVGEWINTVLIPMFVSLWNWLSINIPIAIAALSTFWTGTLLPAIQAVWGWMSGTLFPFFQALGNFLGAVFGLAVRVLAGYWQNILLPALLGVWTVVSTNLMPIFKGLGDFFNSTLLPIIKDVANWIGSVLTGAFDGLTSTIKNVTTWLQGLADGLNGLTLPAALTPGSPTPFELGLKGINEQLRKMASATLPAVTYQMGVLATVQNVPGSSGAGGLGSIVNSSQVTRNYLYGARFDVSNKSDLMGILNGLK